MSGNAQTTNRIGNLVPPCPNCGSDPAANGNVDDICPNCGEWTFLCELIAHEPLAAGAETIWQQIGNPRWRRIPPTEVQKRRDRSESKLKPSGAFTDPSLRLFIVELGSLESHRNNPEALFRAMELRSPPVWANIRALATQQFHHTIFSFETLERLRDWLRLNSKPAARYEWLTLRDVEKMLRGERLQEADHLEETRLWLADHFANGKTPDREFVVIPATEFHTYLTKIGADEQTVIACRYHGWILCDDETCVIYPDIQTPSAENGQQFTEIEPGEGGKPPAEPFADLRQFALANLKGQERTVIEALCNAGGELLLADIKAICEWRDPIDDAWNSLRKRLTNKINPYSYWLVTHDRKARLTQNPPIISPKKSAKRR